MNDFIVLFIYAYLSGVLSGIAFIILCCFILAHKNDSVTLMKDGCKSK